MKQDMRYTERHIKILKAQFACKRAERNTKVLDVMMRHLRFIKRHEKDVRLQFYRAADFIEVPARTLMFSKGDPADYMYIILKGRIVIESTREMYKDIKVHIANLKDGEAFGEMAVFDTNQLYDKNDQQRETKGIDSLEEKKPPSKFVRLVSARTIEHCRLLQISVVDANQIMQPMMKKEQEISTMSLTQSQQPIQVRDFSQSQEISNLTGSTEKLPTIPTNEPKDFFQDELNLRLIALQNSEIFAVSAPATSADLGCEFLFRMSRARCFCRWQST